MVLKLLATRSHHHPHFVPYIIQLIWQRHWVCLYEEYKIHACERYTAKERQQKKRRKKKKRGKKTVEYRGLEPLTFRKSDQQMRSGRYTSKLTPHSRLSPVILN
jgi:hypothetical protein